MNVYLESPRICYRHSPALTIRWATPDDASQVATLAQLDEALIPAPPLLLAFVGDELWSAVSVSSGVTISDPFRPSAEIAAMAAARGRQLTVGEQRLRSRLRRHWPARWSLSTRRATVLEH